MTSVFKFTKRKYTEDAVHRGRIMLTHVAEFRGADGVEAGRYDQTEMIAVAKVAGGEEVISSNSPVAGMFSHWRAGQKVPMETTASGDTITFIDAGLLFCASLDNSDELFAAMAAKFRADSAYEITDAEEFAKRIKDHIVENGDHLAHVRSFERSAPSSLGVDFDQALKRSEQRMRQEQDEAFGFDAGPVTYRDRTDAPSIADIEVDAFLKPTAYAWQHEYRILVRPFEGASSHVVELPALCELIRPAR